MPIGYLPDTEELVDPDAIFKEINGLLGNLPIADHGLISDKEILDILGKTLIIDPFAKESKPGAISYGLTSFGYDIRLNNKYKIIDGFEGIIDPKADNSSHFREVIADYCVIPANGFVLAEAMEWLEMPRDVLAICCGKSTLARCGLSVPMTPVEPEWKGRLTIEIANTTPLPVKVYSFEGICQLVFFRSPYPVNKSYEDKKGKYQNQPGLTLPIVI